jgi:hypothetical protein
MEQDFVTLFGKKPKVYVSPLEPGDHPTKLDKSDLLHIEGIKQYLLIIGLVQWAVQLGRLDVATATMTLSSFQAAPCKGHLEQAEHIVGYLVKNRNALVRVPTDMPDYSALEKPTLNWSQSPYLGAHEIIDPDTPPPLGKSAKCTTNYRWGEQSLG